MSLIVSKITIITGAICRLDEAMLFVMVNAYVHL